MTEWLHLQGMENPGICLVFSPICSSSGWWGILFPFAGTPGEPYCSGQGPTARGRDGGGGGNIRAGEWGGVNSRHGAGLEDQESKTDPGRPQPGQQFLQLMWPRSLLIDGEALRNLEFHPYSNYCPLYTLCPDFCGGSDSKESTCQCRRHRRRRFDPWVGKIAWRREWQPTPVFLPGESHGQKSLEGYSPGGCTELNMTEWLTLSHSMTRCILKKYFLIFSFGCAGSSLLSLVVASGDCSLLQCSGFLLWWLPLLQGTSRRVCRALVIAGHGLQSSGSVAVAHGCNCASAHGIFLDQGLNSCPPHWQA